MAYKMRRWTGFNPSLTSGNALPTITDIAYAKYDCLASTCSSKSTMFESDENSSSSSFTKDDLFPPPPPPSSEDDEDAANVLTFRRR